MCPPGLEAKSLVRGPRNPETESNLKCNIRSEIAHNALHSEKREWNSIAVVKTRTGTVSRSQMIPV